MPSASADFMAFANGTENFWYVLYPKAAHNSLEVQYDRPCPLNFLIFSKGDLSLIFNSLFIKTETNYMI